MFPAWLHELIPFGQNLTRGLLEPQRMRRGFQCAISFHEQGIAGDFAQSRQAICHCGYAPLSASRNRIEVAILHKQNENMQ